MELEEAVKIVRERTVAQAHANGGFDCGHCRVLKPVSDAQFVGVFIPNASMLTNQGEKTRIVGYVLCKKCTQEMSVDQKVAERVEQNIITSGVFLDSRPKSPPE